MRRIVFLALMLGLGNVQAAPVVTVVGGLPVTCSADKKEQDKLRTSMDAQDAQMMRFEGKERNAFLETFNSVGKPTTLSADAVVAWIKGDAVLLGFEIGKKLCVYPYDKVNFESLLHKAFGDPT